MVPDRLRCDYTNYQTPLQIVDAVREMFDGEIVLDPFSNVARWTGTSMNYMKGGEHRPWVDRTYANPPFGSMVEKAAIHADEQARFGHRIAMLIPCGSRFSTKYFQRHVLTSRLTAIVIFNTRLKFVREDGVKTGQMMHDSALWCYNVRAVNVVEAFKDQGKVLAVEVL